MPASKTALFDFHTYMMELTHICLINGHFRQIRIELQASGSTRQQISIECTIFGVILSYNFFIDNETVFNFEAKVAIE